MKKGLMLVLLIALLPVKTMAFQVGKLELASTVRIFSAYSDKLINEKVARLFDDINSEDARKYREDLKQAKVSGSGVMITYDGCFLTSAHVLQDQETGLLFDKSTLLYGAGEMVEPKEMGEVFVAFISPTADLAVACLKENNGKFFQPAKINYEQTKPNLPLGSELYAMGFPGVYGEYVKLVKGIVSGYIKDEPLVATNMSFSPGMSGGPVFDVNSNVVSLITARSLDYSFGLILGFDKFLNWNSELFTILMEQKPEEFADCMPTDDLFYKKADQLYYDVNCKTKKNVAIDDQIKLDYKNFCGKTAKLELIDQRQIAQYIVSGESNMLEWQKYLEWLCWQE